jgi:hypothetical protein
LEKTNTAVAELNKSLHSLRRRKQACPNEIQVCVDLKTDACAIAQMGQCIQKGGAGLSWEGFQVLQEAWDAISFVDEVPLRFKMLELTAHANDLLRFGKFPEILALLTEGKGITLTTSEFQNHRADIVEAGVGLCHRAVSSVNDT